MHVGTRSTLAGMAFVSAGAIALAPVTPIPDIELVLPGSVSAAVQLTANPLEYYAQVVETIIGNAVTLIGDEVANPAPILRALFNNQGVAARELLAVLGNLPTALLSPEFQVQNQLLINSVESFFQSLINNASVNLPLALEGAFDYLAAGDVESALNTILNLGNTLFGAAILGPFAAVQGYLNFLVDTPGGSPQLTGIINAMIGNDQFQLVQTFLGAVGPVISGIGSVGTAIQNVLDAVVAGEVLGVVTALINAPATVIDGVLSGGYGPTVPFLGYYPGILTANAPFLNGPLAVLQSLGRRSRRHWVHHPWPRWRRRPFRPTMPSWWRWRWARYPGRSNQFLTPPQSPPGSHNPRQLWRRPWTRCRSKPPTPWNLQLRRRVRTLRNPSRR